MGMFAGAGEGEDILACRFPSEKLISIPFCIGLFILISHKCWVSTLDCWWTSFVIFVNHHKWIAEYHCGSDQGWSSIFYFRTLPDGTDWSPQFVVFGDLGNTNAQSLPRLQEEAQNGLYDAVLHVGDFAYDMHSVMIFSFHYNIVWWKIVFNNRLLFRSDTFLGKRSRWRWIHEANRTYRSLRAIFNVPRKSRRSIVIPHFRRIYFVKWNYSTILFFPPTVILATIGLDSACQGYRMTCFTVITLDQRISSVSIRNITIFSTLAWNPS